MIKVLMEKMARNPIVRSSVIIALATAGARLLGYMEKIILAYYFGTGSTVDAYNIILTFIFSVFLFFREIVEPAFLPSFLRAVKEEEGKHAWGLLIIFARCIGIGTLLLSVLVCCMPGAAIHLLAPGLTAEKSLLAAKMIRLAFPACIFLSLSALINSALNALKEFALPAASELLFKVMVVLILVLVGRYWGIYAIIAGIMAGALAKLLFQLYILFKKYPFQKPVGKRRYLKETWKLSWLLMIGVGFSQVCSLADNRFASFLPEGSIAALSYAKKMVELPVLVFPYILSTVLFPYFSELVIGKRQQELNNLFSKHLTSILLVFLPLSGFFLIFSHELIELFFKRGAFNEFSTALTGEALAYYSVGMIFFAIEAILVVFYFSNGDTKTPIITGIGCVVLHIVLSYLLTRSMGYLGIALAFVLSRMTKVLLLLFLLKNKLVINYNAVGAVLLKLLFASGLTMLLLLVIKQAMQDAFHQSMAKKAAFLAICALLGMVTYAVNLRLIRFKKTIFYPNLKFNR